MKLKSNLTKRYYFPIVEGSNYGYVFSRGSTYNAFVTYIRGIRGVTKVTNYSQVWHWFANSAVSIRQGYHYSWWSESTQMVKDLSSANKYLNRQYNRMDKHIRAENYEKAVAIWRILHRRSSLWKLVLIIRKLRFLQLSVLRFKALNKSVTKLMRKESFNLKYKRVFLKEYKTDGSLKKLRPLGVPSMEWRVIAASYEFLLVNLWASDWNQNQFACMPGRGVADAWIAILTKLATGKVYEIYGYDLAKFFDTVYISTVKSMCYNLPKFLSEYLTNLVSIKPLIRPQDKIHERRRKLKTLEERPIIHYPEVEDFLTKSEGPYSNSINQSFPQGLNTSPIMSCRALQDTGAINHTNIIQYVDDGLIMNMKGEKRLTLSEFSAQLLTAYTGIAMSESKSEQIMNGGKFITPLKFLGCSYDGRTFKAHTRKGVFEVKDANLRIGEIIEWLKANGHLLGNYRKLLTSLISEGWNPPKSTWYSVPAIKPPWKEIQMNFSSFWEETKAKVEVLKANSVEVMSIETLGPKLGPITSSSNVQTMIGSYYLLKFTKTVKTRKLLGTGILTTSWENVLLKSRLISDW